MRHGTDSGGYVTIQGMTPNPDKICNTCGATIPVAAKLCSVCKTYQLRWKSQLQFVSSILALILASVSLLAWIAGQIPTLRTTFLPRTHIVVLGCNSLEGGLFANLGDETVFLSHVILFNTESQQWVAQRFPINQQLAPNSFLRVPSPWGDGLNGTFARGIRTDALSILIHKAAAGATPCVRMAFFARNDQMYEEELAKAGGSTLNTLPAAGYLEYFSLRSPEKRLQLRIDAIGVIMTSSKPECMAK